MSIKSLRVIAEIVSNDLREVVNGVLDPVDIPYGMICADIGYLGDETQ